MEHLPKFEIDANALDLASCWAGAFVITQMKISTEL